MSSITTKGGDKGFTSLIGGRRVRKTEARVAAYGELDELSSQLGLVSASLTESHAASSPSQKARQPELETRLIRHVEIIQNLLFVAAADMANPSHRLNPQEKNTEKTAIASSPALRITEYHVQVLENMCAFYESILPPLRAFIIPGGCPAAAHAHLARAVCRRAERAYWNLQDTSTDDLGKQLPAFLNRLSDTLFLLARACNFCRGLEDLPVAKNSFFENISI